MKPHFSWTIIRFPTWLVYLIALPVAFTSAYLAYQIFRSPEFDLSCDGTFVTINGRYAMTFAWGFTFVALAATLALFRMIRFWLPGSIGFFGVGGLITIGTGMTWGCGL